MECQGGLSTREWKKRNSAPERQVADELDWFDALNEAGFAKMQVVLEETMGRGKIDKCQKLAPVKLTQTVTLGPRQVKCVKAEIEDHRYGKSLCIEIGPRHKLFSTTSVVCNYAVQDLREGKLDICLSNFSNKWVTLNRKSHVANAFSQIEEEELFEFDGDDDAISTYTERGSLSEKLTEVPEWERLINIENPVMTDVMKAQLMEVLRSASGVMPTKERPLGRCNIVKHKINTADSAPIKVRPIPYNPEKGNCVTIM